MCSGELPVIECLLTVYGVDLVETVYCCRHDSPTLNEIPAAFRFVELAEKRRKQFRNEIRTAVGLLESLARHVDPVKEPATVFDPADPHQIGRLIGDTLLEQQRFTLASLHRFYGSGVYAIYSRSNFAAYRLIKNTDVPIYVGKADPADVYATEPREQGEKLWGRLKEHAKSIASASNLEIDDFECRYLVVRSAWQTTAEDYLIGRFQPIWNKQTGVCHGFGKHGDSPETRANKRSPWDALHPGRQWATREGNQESKQTSAATERKILDHLEQMKAKNPDLFAPVVM